MRSPCRKTDPECTRSRLHFPRTRPNPSSTRRFSAETPPARHERSRQHQRPRWPRLPSVIARCSHACAVTRAVRCGAVRFRAEKMLGAHACAQGLPPRTRVSPTTRTSRITRSTSRFSAETPPAASRTIEAAPAATVGRGYHSLPVARCPLLVARYGRSFDVMIVPAAANMPPTPWARLIFAPGTWAGATPRSWRTLSWRAYMPYMPECM